MIALTLAAIMFPSPMQATKTYQNKELNLAFNYPSTWSFVNSKIETKFNIPIQGSGKSATLEIFAVKFGADIALFQKSQEVINKQLKREVAKQWQEEILGAPLLLTLVNFDLGDEKLTSMVGLIYSRTAKKLNFRLTAPTTLFPTAEQSFRDVLPSLRTTNGDLPGAEDPSKPPPNPKIKVEQPIKGPVKRIEDPNTKLKPPVKAPVAITVTVGDKPYKLFVPAGWSGTVDAGGAVILKRPELDHSISVEAKVATGEDSPAKALYKASSISLEKFTKVTLRQEPQARRNQGGAMVVWILRQGTATNGELISWDAAGAIDNAYWLFSISTDSVSKFSQDRKWLEQLIEEMSFEPDK